MDAAAGGVRYRSAVAGSGGSVPGSIARRVAGNLSPGLVSGTGPIHNGLHAESDIAGRRPRHPLNRARQAIMFSRDKSKDSAGTKPAQTAAPRPEPAKQPEPVAESKPEQPPQRATAKPSVITGGLHVTGNLASGGELLVDGSVTGDIHVGRLTIGPSGKVEGKIVAEEITVSGSVEGLISAKTVTIGRTAHVAGDVLHDVLSIESGAEFQGRCQRRPASELEKPKTASQMAQEQKPAQPQRKAADAQLQAAVRPVNPAKPAGASAPAG